MFEELLPPDGVMVPSEILYNKSLSVGLKTTWMLLRGLAGEDGETPLMAISTLCEVTGKCRATIYGHLSKLSALGLLWWQPRGIGRLSVTFIPESQQRNPAEDCGDESKNLDNLSKNLDSNSLKLKALTQREDLLVNSTACVKEIGVQEFRQSVQEFSPAQDQERPSQPEQESEKTPAQVYREVMHLTANRLQREEMDSTVSDVELWRQTLKFWMLHNWNPFNVPGLLDMYAQGGPQSVRQKAASRDHRKPPLGDHSEQRERDRQEARRIIAQARQKRRLSESASQPREG